MNFSLRSPVESSVFNLQTAYDRLVGSLHSIGTVYRNGFVHLDVPRQFDHSRPSEFRPTEDRSSRQRILDQEHFAARRYDFDLSPSALSSLDFRRRTDGYSADSAALTDFYAENSAEHEPLENKKKRLESRRMTFFFGVVCERLRK